MVGNTRWLGGQALFRQISNRARTMAFSVEKPSTNDDRNCADVSSTHHQRSCAADRLVLATQLEGKGFVSNLRQLRGGGYNKDLKRLEYETILGGPSVVPEEETHHARNCKCSRFFGGVTRLVVVGAIANKCKFLSCDKSFLGGPHCRQCSCLPVNPAQDEHWRQSIEAVPRPSLFRSSHVNHFGWKQRRHIREALIHVPDCLGENVLPRTSRPVKEMSTVWLRACLGLKPV